MRGHVVAMGGGEFLAGDPASPLDDLLLGLTGVPRPHVVFVPTATGASESAVDDALRDAWERGAALGGVSAGANCWFEACVTDSFSAELDGLGLLARSYCPNFDSEERRR